MHDQSDLNFSYLTKHYLRAHKVPRQNVKRVPLSVSPLFLTSSYSFPTTSTLYNQWWSYHWLKGGQTPPGATATLPSNKLETSFKCSPKESFWTSKEHGGSWAAVRAQKPAEKVPGWLRGQRGDYIQVCPGIH